MIEDGARQNKTVRERNSNANGNSLAEIAQHAAGSGTVKINTVINTSKHGGNDVRLLIDRKAYMADERFIENFVDGFPIIGPAMRFADHACAVGESDGF